MSGGEIDKLFEITEGKGGHSERIVALEKQREDDKELKDLLRNTLKILNGNGHIGIISKVQFMWGAGRWILVIISGILTGFGIALAKLLTG